MNLTRKFAFVTFACFWTLAAHGKTIADGIEIENDTSELTADFDQQFLQLGEVVVKGTRQIMTEKATVDALKTSLSVASAVSG